MNRREETESVYVFIFIVSFVHDKCRFSLYFILTARNAILSGGYLFPQIGWVVIIRDSWDRKKWMAGYPCI